MTTVIQSEFNAWMGTFRALAKEAGFPVSDDEWVYLEYFEDGDTPESALAEEMSRADG